MLGSLSEADDAVQEAWLRLSRADTSEVENLGGWLTTVVARVCLNVLRARRSRREEPLDVHVPDPIVSRDGRDSIPSTRRCWPTRSASRCWSCSRRWRPPSGWRSCCTTCSRVPFDEIAAIVGRSPAAARQLASRARRRVQGAAPVPDADLAAPARGRRRLLRRRARRRLRCARRGARPGRRAALRRRRAAPGATARGPRRAGGGRAGADLRAASRRTCGRRSSTAPRASSWRRTGGRSRSWASPSSDGRIVAIDAIADPERLRRARPGRARRLTAQGVAAGAASTARCTHAGSSASARGSTWWAPSCSR